MADAGTPSPAADDAPHGMSTLKRIGFYKVFVAILIALCLALIVILPVGASKKIVE